MAMHSASTRLFTVLALVALVSVGCHSTIHERAAQSLAAERPDNVVKYFTPGELVSKWANITVSDEDWNLIETVDQAATPPSNPQDQGVAYELELQAGRKRHYSIGCADPVQGDIIVARFYLPDTPDIRDNTVWLTAKARPGPSNLYSLSHIPLGKWTQIMLDMRGVNDSDGKPLNERPFYITVVYTIEANTMLLSETLRVGLRDVAVYKDVGPRIVEGTATPSPPQVALVSLSYKVDGFDPRLVDLRNAPTIGIPARADQRLQFSDLWISVSKYAPKCTAWAEIYDDPRLGGGNSKCIGTASLEGPWRSGHLKLGAVQVGEFMFDDNEPYTWRVQSHWTDLYVAVVTSCENEKVGVNTEKIHLDAAGTAWLLDPPNVSFASIVYAVNGGEPQVTDLRDATTAGIGAGPGDEIRLFEIWYHACLTTTIITHR